ncbi:MAG TPA: thioredoxin family protein [Terracidiphilus sp.]|nr:thioredoxin family protein [Terracidiphilus sp.]
MRVLRSIVAISFLLVASLSASAQLTAPASQPQDTKAAFTADHLRVELLVTGARLYTGDEGNQAGLYFKLQPGWHVYWQNAGDAGEPPAIDWTLPKGLTAGPLHFPAPTRLPVGPLMDYGYENQVLFPFRINAAPAAKLGPADLRAHVTWLVCSSVCIPGKADLELTRPVARGPAPSTPESPLFQQFLSRLPQPLPKGDKAVFQSTPTGFRLALDTGHRETQAEFFPSDQTVVDNPSPQKLAPTPKGIVLTLKKDADIAGTPAHLNGVIELSGDRAYHIAAVPGAVAAPAEPASAAGISLLALSRVAALAFLGGLLLNLMPCVFPVLFLKGLALLNSCNEERNRLRAHGLVYAAGILVSFWALVGVLLGLRAAGSSIGWGFQFQSPVFLLLMAGLLFFLGLSLAGQFEIGLTLTSTGGSLAARQGYTGSFFTGVLAVIVATPCAAPFMGAAIGYALAAPAAATFTVFTALAIGLAAPYVILTLQPAWTRILPRPGRWMEILRQIVSVPIFITVIWLAWVLTQGYGADLLAALLCIFLLLAIAGWFLGHWPAKRWSAIVGTVIVLCAVAIGFAAPAELATTPTPSTTASAVQSQWQPWTPIAVSQYTAQGRPVFVDFTASWCLSCQVNERVALDRPQVQQAFAKADVVLLRADWTRHDPAITQALAALGRDSVPVYLLYAPGQNAPQILPAVLTPGIVVDALNRLPRISGTTQASAASSDLK